MRVPDYLCPWWAELSINSATANATHEVWRVRGPGGSSRFRAAVRSAVARHDILTRAVVRREGAFYLERSSAEVSSTTARDESAQLQRTIFSLVWTPFAEGAALFRPFVIEISATDAVCGFVLHHRVVDYYGVQILAREIRDEILGAAPGEACEERERPRYADFLQGMADWVTGAEAGKRLEFWRECMRDAPPTCLRNAVDVAATATGSLHYIDFDLSATLRDQLAAAARACRSTMNLVTMAVHHIALAVESGQRDVIAKVIVSGRDTPELLDMIGYTADCFPLRAAIDPQASFAGFVREMQRKFGLASRHRVKSELVEQAMKDVGASAVAPVFNFAAGLEDAVAAKPANGAAADLRLESIPVDRAPEIGSGAFNMSHGLTLFDTGQMVLANVKYLSLRHDRRTVEAFIERVSRCLTAVGREPFAPVARIMES